MEGIKYNNDDKWYCKINQQVTSFVCHYESLDTETLKLQPLILIFLSDIRLWQTNVWYSVDVYFPPLSIKKLFYINFIYFVLNFKDLIPRISFQHDSIFWLVWSQFPHQSFNLWQCVVRMVTEQKFKLYWHIRCETPQTFSPTAKTKKQPSLLHYRITHIWKFKNEPQK